MMVVASQIHLETACLLRNSLDHILLYLQEMLTPLARVAVWPAPLQLLTY